VLLYNANGREIGSVDTQPAKFLARELALRQTLTLDRVVADQPAYADRPSFARDRHGHWRPAYPILSGMLAALPASLGHASGLVDMAAPRAPGLVAAVTASALTAAAVVLVLLSLARIVPARAAWLTAVGLGLGTGYWSTVSQTLWQHESVAFGFALALWAWLRPHQPPTWAAGAAGGLGLAMAVAARPQVAPIVAVWLVWYLVRHGPRASALPAAVVGASAAIIIWTNLAWFGHPLGALPALEALHPVIHAVDGSLGDPVAGLAGLLVSPSRGLFVFYPIALVVLLGVPRVPGRPEAGQLGFLLAAGALQLFAYSLYSVWWGGHTYGPRYALDLLIPLAPAAALGVHWLTERRWPAPIALVLLGWSVLVAGAGAFVYPNDRWNTSPANVDLHHERLWDWRGSQIARVFTTRPSPQNFNLFGPASVRRNRE
jgi:MFS family permease